MAATDLVLVGAGLRGAKAYGAAALRHPGEARFVAVVEPNPARRLPFAEAHGIEPARAFERLDDLLAAGPLAEGAVVATPDRQHAGPAVACLEAGYHTLVEKPMAPTPQECVAMIEAAARHRRHFQVCHVLRHTAFWQTLHDVVTSGRLGDVVSVEHRENVAYWHMAHSYVRGAYGNVGRSTPMVLAKCCHDLDQLVWNLPSPVARLSSAGSLVHFRADRAPEGAAARCTDGCAAEAACQYSALHVYLGAPEEGGRWRPETPFTWMPLTDHGDWDPAAGGLTETTDERLAALRTGPFGRCVYSLDNDAVDNQVVWMELEGGGTATLIFHGHAHDDQRTLRYDGTLATLRGRFGDFSGAELTIHHHRGGAVEEVPIPATRGLHGGGDAGVLRNFCATLRGEEAIRTDGREALESHLLGFAAEEARHSGTVVDVAAYRAAHGLAPAP